MSTTNKTKGAGSTKTPAMQLVELNKELAKQQKANELLTTKLKTTYKQANPMSKEALDEVFDPADPSATTKAVADYSSKLDEDIDKLLADITKETEGYVNEQYPAEKLDVQTHLAQWAEANKTELTYDQLMDEVPNKILKKLKVEGTNPEDVFKEASKYLTNGTQQTQEVYNPQAPHNHSNANQAPANTGTPDTTDDDEEGIY